MATATSSFTSTGSEVSDIPKNPDYYLPPIVRSLGEDVVVNKVRLQCKAITDGRYLYTYTMDLAQDHPQGLRTERSIDMIDESSVGSRSVQSKKSHRNRKDSSSCNESTDYSVKSYQIRRPEPVIAPLPQTAISVQKPVAYSPKAKNVISLTDFTVRSGEHEDENTAEIRQEITVTFYLFGQTERGDYFRLRLFDAFPSKTSVRRVLKAFALATDHSFKDFVDHIYVLPGYGEHLKNATKWKKLPRDSVSQAISDLGFNTQPFSDEFVMIADLIGVHAMSPAVRRSIGKK
ncbi:hypothetical protein PMAYCL1PPCAC_17742 [Pristionchus mayeri]|uniref:Uncharacterized protein n=1 Tax=Pristionchus mayeri TaxID=1317129 RepID=A0AAN5I0M5_9BILA|nr:hypothetical protein PMAYCL1PPCAC_17742 [Pristionchus mayeri]